MYKAFSEIKNVDKMVRSIVVFLEEETLNCDLEIYNLGLSKFNRQYGEWVKYVSTASTNPREVFIYWDRVYEEKFIDNLIYHVLENGGFLEELNDYFVKSYSGFKNKTDDFYKSGASFFQAQTNSSLTALFGEFNAVNIHVLSAYYVPFYLVLALSKLIKKELFLELKQEEAKSRDEMFETISKVGIKTVVREERLSFLSRLKTIQGLISDNYKFDSRKIQNLIEKQWYKFGACVYTHEEASVYSLADYKKKFRDSLDLDIDFEADKLKKAIRKDDLEVKKALLRLNSNKNLLEHIKWLRIMMSYRNRDAEYYDAYFDHCMPFFEEVAKRLKIKTDGLWLLSKAEIIGGLENKLNTSEIIAKRKKLGFTIKQVGQKIIVSSGVSKSDLYERKINEKVKLIRGNVASRGTVKGFVRVIFNPLKEAAKFKNGEILVTSMTTPDFVPLMKKAEAIITDEGGVLCHAAIVSREFNIPCIVGTKISTRVLKNGDFVEVDAENGLVKVVKR